MVGRICSVFVLLLRCSWSEVFQGTTTPAARQPQPPLSLWRRLQQYYTGGNNGYNSGVYANNDGLSNNYAPNNGGADDSGYYTIPGQGNNGQHPFGPAFGNQANTVPGQGPVEPFQPTMQSTTRSWRGSSVAFFGSDPFSRDSSADSKDSSSASFHTRASEWSSSGSGSGSGWLWPWDYTNYPWKVPYWAWWQYFMTICVAIYSCCCLGLCSSCLYHYSKKYWCPWLFKPRPVRRKKNKVQSENSHSHHGSHHGSHHHSSHRSYDSYEDDEESEYSDTSEDLEDDPSRRKQQGSSHSTREPSGHSPYRGNAYSGF